MKTGDILLIKRKYCPIGWLIRKFWKSEYNHTAWAINEEIVLEMGATGNRLRPIKKYLNQYYKIRVLRPTYPDKLLLEKVQYFMTNAEFKYSYLSFVIMGIQMVLGQHHKIKRSFCAKFVADGLRYCGIEICKDTSKVIPENFLNVSMVIK